MKLSAREKEVLALLGDGYMNVNIAARLNLSEETVRAHLKRIYAKLGIKGFRYQKRRELKASITKVIG